MTKVSSLQIERLTNSIDVLKKALFINILVILVRLSSYLFCLAFKKTEDNDFSPSYHF